MITNRRRLLQGAAVAGAGVALGTAGPAPSVAAQATATAEVDEFKIAMPALPPQLDPQTSSWIVMQRTYPLLFDTLIKRDWKQNGALTPGLAASWSQVDDLTLEVTLRDGVLFHDGTPVTAADVKYTLERSIQNDPNLEVTGIWRLARVDVVDDRTARIVTERPSGSLLLQLTAKNASIIPMAYHQRVGYEEFQRAPIGTGPFKLTAFVPDSHIAFVRNDQYYDGSSAVKAIRLTGVPEVSTRIAALLNGELDLVMDLPPDQVPTVESAGGFKIDSVAPLNVNLLDINGRNAPMEKQALRQALSLAVDRQTIVEELLLGNGLWPSGIQSVLDPLYVERPKLVYDPERAKALLAEAGYAGEEIQFVYDSPDYYPLGGAWAEAIAGMWSEIGVNVKMVGMEVGQRVEAASPEQPYQVIISSSGVLADIEISQNYGSTTAVTPSFFAPGALDEVVSIFQEAGATIDQTERAAIYQRAFDLLDEITPTVVLFTINRVAGFKDTYTWAGSPDFGIDLRASNFSVS